jgi:hypothetical protein
MDYERQLISDLRARDEAAFGRRVGPPLRGRWASV